MLHFCLALHFELRSRSPFENQTNPRFMTNVRRFTVEDGLGAIVLWIMSGWLNPVPIDGEAFVVLEIFKCRQAVW